MGFLCILDSFLMFYKGTQGSAHLYIFIEACTLRAWGATLLRRCCSSVDSEARGGWGRGEWRWWWWWWWSAGGGQGLHARKYHSGHGHISCQTTVLFSQRGHRLLQEERGDTLKHERHFQKILAFQSLRLYMHCNFRSCCLHSIYGYSFYYFAIHFFGCLF